MKIAILSPEAIYPANSGGRVVVFNRIEYLLKNNEVFIFSIVDNLEEINIQNNYYKQKGVYCKSYNRNEKRSYIDYLIRPVSVASRTNKILKNDLRRCIDTEHIDIVLVEFPQMFENINSIHKKEDNYKCLLSLHNIEYLSLNSIAKSNMNKIKKIVYTVEAYRLKKFEQSIYKLNWMDGYIFVSDKDEDFFNQNLNYLHKKTFISPIGSYSNVGLKEKKNEKAVVLVGKMSYQPNIEGVQWFVNNIWNELIEWDKSIKLYIVGKDPVSEIKQLENENVIVTGTVDSIDPYYRKAMMAVVPILSGGGVKTKLIEAASYGIPIVCTSHSVIGTVFQNNVDLIVVDEPGLFIESIKLIFKNEKIREKLSFNISKKFKDNYEWDNICEKLERFINDCN